jgi:uncharacterized iron-regulated protein
VRVGLVAFMALAFSGCATAAAPSHPVPTPAPEASEIPREVPEGVLLFHGDGTPADFDEIVDAARSAEVVLLGELHDDRVGHRARHALTARQIDAGDPVTLSLEMFETDVQPVVDEYLAGIITEDHFRAAARPWVNYEDDYRPYIELARSHALPVIAANPPRRYVNAVSREGPEILDSLSEEALRWLPPLPYPEPSDAYRQEWDALMGGHGAHNGERLLLSQALWDAGMAWSIVGALEEGRRVIHVAGAFHVANGTGIPEALEHYRPGTEVLTIVGYRVPESGGFEPEAHAGLGDFVLLTPRD